jgi:hypothetical protein
LSSATLLALLRSPGWEAYLTVAQVTAVAWVAFYLTARRAAQRTRLRYIATTVSRGLGWALIASDLFDIVVQAGARQMQDAVISAVGAFAVAVALRLLGGDDWFSDTWAKAKRKLRSMAARRRTRAAIGGAGA